MASEQKKDLSNLELDLLRHLAASDGMSVREIADGFGAENGYARTTIQTLLERLRAKTYATRKQKGGHYVYRSALTQAELMKRVVSGFVNRALGGSVSPLVSYLVAQSDLSDEEIARLETMIEQLKEDRDE